MFTNILLASDGSVCSLRAAAIAAAMASTFKARLTVINVFEPFPSIEPYPEAVQAGLDHQDVADSQEHALSAACLIVDEKDLSYQRRREVGHPAAEIVRVAGEEGCDLIVIGGRGQSGVESFLLGSVSDRVAHYAQCPVLIVK
jgi:nucleotide-binding universal stress UspA family protein